MSCSRTSERVTSPRGESNSTANCWCLAAWSPHQLAPRCDCSGKCALDLSLTLYREAYPAAHDPASYSATVANGVAASGVGQRKRQKRLTVIVVLLGNVDVRGINGGD